MKQALLVRHDLNLPKGKMAAQVAHASVDATLKSEEKMVKKWRKQGMAKIVLKVKDEDELIQLFQTAKEKGVVASLITDAGKTVVAPGTKTAVALGPDEDKNIDALVGHLTLV